MTIAKKLTYLAATKTAIREAIEAKGVTVGDIPFRQYADKIALISEEEPQYSVWGVDIDYTNSNPETSVTYTDDAVGMTPGGAAWNLTALFANIKPCMFKNGAVNYYLDPDNFGKKADGVTNADITLGNDGDVMIEIPKLGYKIETVGSTLKVRVTDNPADENFCYYAHTRTTEGDKDYLYVSAYKGYVNSSVLWSLSGKTLTDGISMESFRAAAQGKGSGYDLLSFYPLTLLQCLFLIRYKSLDSQTALGEGYTKSTNTSFATTGGTNTKGMYWGGTDTQQVKFAGIEDMWGNAHAHIEGILIQMTSGNLVTAFKNFNSTGSGYTTLVSSYHDGTNIAFVTTMKKAIGSNAGGFIATEWTGDTDNDTYFCDGAGRQNILAHRQMTHGAWLIGAKSAGMFTNVFRLAFTSTNTNYNGRLMYL